MRTTCCNVYAAGDVCSVNWPGNSTLWFQVNYTQSCILSIIQAVKCVYKVVSEQVTLLQLLIWDPFVMDLVYP